MARTVRKTDSGLRWGEGYVQPRTLSTGEERFVARWPEGEGLDRRWRGKTCRTLDEAEDLLRDIARRQRSGQYEPESRMTVAELIDDYMDRMESEWRPNTYATYRVYRNRTIVPHLGKRKIAELTTPHIQRWLDTIARSGKRRRDGSTGALSRSSVANSLTLLSSALQAATRLGLIAHNPADGVQVSGLKSERRPVWSLADARKVLAVVREDPFRRAMYTVALMTGVRPGELRALRWGDIDLAKGTILVQRTVTRDRAARQIVGTTTKTGTTRLVAVPALVVEALRAWQASQATRREGHAAWHDEDIVFDRGDGRFLPSESILNIHREVIAHAGVPPIRMHDMRHTYATLELEGGTHPRIVSERMGHKSSSMTDRYMHMSLDLQHQVAEAMADRLLAEPDTTT